VYKRIKSRREVFVYISFAVLLLSLLIRLAYIHFYRSDFLREIAKKQHSIFVEIEPKRGAILDRNLSSLALNICVDSLYAVPYEINDKEATAQYLADILRLDYSSTLERLKRDKSFVWIARKISQQDSQTIKKANIKGLGFIKESKRSYPKGVLSSHVIGFAGLDNYGLEGLELFYNEQLSGKKGWSVFLRDARQRKLIETSVLPAKDGFSLLLNIDEVIQFIAETELDKAFKKTKAKGASIIIIEPSSGRILAMANRPTYDPNDFANSSHDERRNRAICNFFEPGSVFKIVTASAALAENKVSEEDKFFCENGEYRVANNILHDHRPHGWLTFRGIIRESSNIGVTKIAQILGPELIYRYIKLYGFGDLLGIDLNGEVEGIIRPSRTWSKTSIGAIPIGHEVCVSALQLVSAVAAIANGGLLMQPFLVDSVVDENNNKIKENQPWVIRRVMSQDTARRVKDMLVEVVESGTGRMGKIASVKVAGKTGTAQKIDKAGGYSHSKFIASFIGFAPADEPEIAMVVTLDEPYPYYGGVVAAPVFKEVTTEVLKYLKSRHFNSKLFYEAKRTTP